MCELNTETSKQLTDMKDATKSKNDMQSKSRGQLKSAFSMQRLTISSKLPGHSQNTPNPISQQKWP